MLLNQYSRNVQYIN